MEQKKFPKNIGLTKIWKSEREWPQAQTQFKPRRESKLYAEFLEPSAPAALAERSPDDEKATREKQEDAGKPEIWDDEDKAAPGNHRQADGDQPSPALLNHLRSACWANHR